MRDFANQTFDTSMVGSIDPFSAVIQGLKLKGSFKAVCMKADGTIRWALDNINGVANLGFNLMLDSTFRSASITTLSSWFIGLISSAGYTGLAAGDTMASHTGWTEDTTHYTAANRPAWTPAAAASKSISNASPVNFAMNTDNTIIEGIFVTSDNTLGGTSGTLWANGLFGSPQTLFNGDTLKITYTVALS